MTKFFKKCKELLQLVYKQLLENLANKITTNKNLILIVNFNFLDMIFYLIDN
jgi:hypothetical protein